MGHPPIFQVSRGTSLESSQNETSENGFKMTLRRSQKVRKTTYDIRMFQNQPN